MNNKRKRGKAKYLRHLKPNPSLLIRNWKELSEIPQESETHIMKIEKSCGWLKVKPEHEKEYDSDTNYINQISNIDHYLSTHTFYGNNHKASTLIFRKCGFNITIDNWDK